jgi:hypothetical protein
VPVRDSTAWRHAIINKKVINMDHGGAKHVMCAWDTCERDGYQNNRVRVNNGTPTEPRYMNYIFCTNRHKMYWLASMRSGNNNNLPAGYKRSII